MKKILLILIFFTTSSYAKNFPDILNNTKWRQTSVKVRADFIFLEFEGDTYTWEYYKGNKLESSKVYTLEDFQIHGDIIFVWYKGYANPDIFIIQGASTPAPTTTLIPRTSTQVSSKMSPRLATKISSTPTSTSNTSSSSSVPYYGQRVLLAYGYNTRDRKSKVNKYISVEY